MGGGTEATKRQRRFEHRIRRVVGQSLGFVGGLALCLLLARGKLHGAPQDQSNSEELEVDSLSAMPTNAGCSRHETPKAYPSADANLTWDWTPSETDTRPCAWCDAHPTHVWCKGWGGKYCRDGRTCHIAVRQLSLFCGRAVDSRKCDARCLHAISSSPISCLDAFVALSDARPLKQETGRKLVSSNFSSQNEFFPGNNAMSYRRLGSLSISSKLRRAHVAAAAITVQHTQGGSQRKNNMRSNTSLMQTALESTRRRAAPIGVRRFTNCTDCVATDARLGSYVRDTVRRHCQLHPASKWGYTTTNTDVADGVVDDPSLKRARKVSAPRQTDVDASPLVVFMHLQKTGGWSLVAHAQRVGVRCPPPVAAEKLHKNTRSHCTYKPEFAEDHELLRSGGHDEQRAVLAALGQAYGLLHLEQVMNPTPLPPSRTPGHLLFEYVTVIREPISRLLSHFRMATRPVDIPGLYTGLPFPDRMRSGNSAATIGQFARQPLTNCVLCSKRRVRMRGSKHVNSDPATMRGGGEFRHCCRKQWRYAADNFYVRELAGIASLSELNFGNVSGAHLELALERLELFKVVLITERLDLAPIVLQHRLGWPIPEKQKTAFAHVNAAVSTGADNNNNNKESRRGESDIVQEAEFRKDPAALALLRERNVYDLRLYAGAVAIWEEAHREALQSPSDSGC